MSSEYFSQISGTNCDAAAKGIAASERERKQGGYLLKYPPEQYTMFQILTATEGSLSPVECVENCASPCKNQNQCVTYRMWKKLDTAIHDTLEGITLADLWTAGGRSLLPAITVLMRNVVVGNAFVTESVARDSRVTVRA